MFERGGGGKAPWWSVATCLREVEEGGWKELMATGSSWQSWWLEVEANEMRGSRKGYKIYEESLMSETGKKSD
jgi:hypothetical protein